MKSIDFILLVVVATVNAAWVAAQDCDPTCGTGAYQCTGVCQPNGQCLCSFDWTGPSTTETSVYIQRGMANGGQILTTEGCTKFCPYSKDHENPMCAVLSQPCAQDCVPPNGTCVGECGICLCAAGQTGETVNVSRYIAFSGPGAGMIRTTDGSGCTRSCNYGPDNLDTNCAMLPR